MVLEFLVGGRAWSRAKPLSTGWVSKREEEAGPHPKPPGHLPCALPPSPRVPPLSSKISQHHTEDTTFNIQAFGGHWAPELWLYPLLHVLESSGSHIQKYPSLPASVAEIVASLKHRVPCPQSSCWGRHPAGDQKVGKEQSWGVCYICFPPWEVSLHWQSRCWKPQLLPDGPLYITALSGSQSRLLSFITSWLGGGEPAAAVTAPGHCLSSWRSLSPIQVFVNRF